jgi:hypothetical protein
MRSTQNAHLQPRFMTAKPDMNGAVAGAIPIATPYMPMA